MNFKLLVPSIMGAQDNRAAFVATLLGTLKPPLVQDQLSRLW